MKNASDYNLDDMVNSYAVEIFEQTTNRYEAQDLVREYADGSEWVIYYSKAHDLCRNCNIDQGHDFIAECYSDVPMTYNDMACRLAYGEISARLAQAVDTLYSIQEEQAA
jgi:hypothetical protein